jgi:transposase-like protein
MAVNYLGEKSNNKKEKIIALLSEGKLSVKEIAKTLNTTEGNVYKERSKARALLVRRKTRSDETLIVAGESESLALRSQRLKPEVNHYQYLNVPALDADGIKKLYSEFKAGKKPADIMAEHGFHPEVVEKEYQRFLKMNERDIDIFQNKIISDIIKWPSKNTTPLLEKYKTKRFLTHDELFELCALKLKDDYERKIDMWAFDKDEYVPKGWSRIKCKVCNQTESEVILNPSFGIGKDAFEYFENYVCYGCKNPELP